MIALSGYVGASLWVEQHACTPSLNREILRSTLSAVPLVDEIAAGQERERAEAGAAQEEPARRIPHQLDGILDQQNRDRAGNAFANARHGVSSHRPAIMARRLFGTSSATAICTTRKPTIADMAKKCT